MIEYANNSFFPTPISARQDKKGWVSAVVDDGLKNIYKCNWDVNRLVLTRYDPAKWYNAVPGYVRDPREVGTETDVINDIKVSIIIHLTQLY